MRSVSSRSRAAETAPVTDAWSIRAGLPWISAATIWPASVTMVTSRSGKTTSWPRWSRQAPSGAGYATRRAGSSSAAASASTALPHGSSATATAALATTRLARAARSAGTATAAAKARSMPSAAARQS